MMTIDVLIFVVVILSFLINILALAAFWVTPGLRTTANRFTINLVIINLVGCVVLAPTLFLSGGEFVGGPGGGSNDGAGITTGSSESGLSFLSPNENDDSIEFYSKPGNHQLTIRHNGRLVEKEGFIVRRNSSSGKEANDGVGAGSRTIETIYKCNDTYCRELTIDESVETLVITEIEEESFSKHMESTPDEEQIEQQPWHNFQMRSWSIDMVAALGAMAVLLVVGDTWCAVTDPLRYHIRISGLKSWILIALTWSMGILFGALSALREIDFEADTLVRKDNTEYTTYFSSLSSSNNIFELTFSCLYFVLIVLLPFVFVCGMYWRIINEARGNGLRMRQNGSSPLMQSSLNLMHRSSISSTSTQGGGLQMSIDKQPQEHGLTYCPQKESTPISEDRLSELDGKKDNTVEIDIQQHQTENVLVTLEAANVEVEAFSLPQNHNPLTTSSYEHQQHVRQVLSSLNLQRNLQQVQHLQNAEASPFVQGNYQEINERSPTSQLEKHSLQMANVHTSPKALGYMSSLRHRLSNASSLFKYREESRAARISILVVIMFLTSYMPFGLLVLLQNRVSAASFLLSNELAIFMILLANLSSAFIFAYRNKRVRRGVKRLLGCDSLWTKAKLNGYSSFNYRRNLNTKTNSSRSSAHSNNSNHHQHPTSSSLMFSNVNTSNIFIRPTSTCSTIINLTINNSIDPCQKAPDRTNGAHAIRSHMVLQQGDIAIVEQMPLNGRNASPKSSIIRNYVVSKTSQKLVCDAAYSGIVKAEPTEV
uniref:G-protein coupled receptors family 1 profile domain-containing protein n=1 Tax=Stomoxys calcitrans TaxID=35570 RepID=A0A1I8NLF0_STOCA